jgi:hypothetical protein
MYGAVSIECPVTLCQYFEILFLEPFPVRNVMSPILNGYGTTDRN